MVEKALEQEKFLSRTMIFVGECNAYKEHSDYIITALCECNNVSMKDVQDLVKSVITNLYEIIYRTKTGNDCGRRKNLIKSIMSPGLLPCMNY